MSDRNAVAIYINLTEQGDSPMLVYQLYCLNEKGNDDLIGILPERRLNPGRITDRSILRWATEAMGSCCQGRKIRFVRVNMVEENQEIH